MSVSSSFNTSASPGKCFCVPFRSVLTSLSSESIGVLMIDEKEAIVFRLF